MRPDPMTFVSTLLGGILASASALAGPAKVDTPAAVEAVLVQYLETFSAMEARGTPADELAKFLFWPEAVLTGEGVEKAARGFDQLAAAVKASGEEVGECHHAIFDPIVVSGQLASQIIQYSCQTSTSSPAVVFRVLYVWEKRGKEWKVIREMYTAGALQ